MQTYQSFVYLVFHQGAQDQIAVGYLLSDNRTTLLQLSQNKIDAVMKLFSPIQQTLIKQAINDLKEIFHLKNGVGRITEAHNDFINTLKIEQWCIYQNNLISFSKPQTIDIEPTIDNLNKLFITLVDAQEKVNISGKSKKSILQKTFYPAINTRVNTNYLLTSTELPTLFLPIQLNFIGQNGVPIIGKEIDFGKKIYNLSKELTEIYAVQKAFEAHQHQSVTFFIIGDEPLKSSMEQHKIWENMLNFDKNINIIPTKETNKIVEYLEQNDVQPFKK